MLPLPFPVVAVRLVLYRKVILGLNILVYRALFIKREVIFHGETEHFSTAHYKLSLLHAVTVIIIREKLPEQENHRHHQTNKDHLSIKKTIRS